MSVQALAPERQGFLPATQQEAIDLLESLVRIESYSGVERDASAFLARWFTAHGLDGGIDRSDSVWGIRPTVRRKKQAQIVLLGHIDTVPGIVPVRIEDGVLWGRGSVDAKGPLCTFAVAATRARLPESVELVVLGCTEEEAETSRGSRHALSVYDPDAVIIGEPSGWDGITLGYKGRMLATYELTRPWSHSAGPQGSAADAAMDWWARVSHFVRCFNTTGGAADDGSRGVFDSLQATVHEIQSFNNGLTDSVRMHTGFRLPPGLTPAELETNLRTFLDEQTLDARPALHCSGRELACRSERSNPSARALRAAIRNAGGRPIDKVKTGTSDMNVVGAHWTCPIVAYGPGDAALDHTPDERQNLDEYWRAIGVLTCAIETLAAELASRGHGASA